MELWVRTLVKHGIRSFWIYDCLYNMAMMEHLCRVASDSGAEVCPAIMFGLSPVHTDEWFAGRVRTMTSWGCADTVYVGGRPRHPHT
jgi:oxaloacetate decarboxylase alpha subunit